MWSIRSDSDPKASTLTPKSLSASLSGVRSTPCSSNLNGRWRRQMKFKTLIYILLNIAKRFVLIANQCVYMQPGNRKICPQWRPSFFMTRTRYFIYGIFGISELFGCSVSENTLRATQSSSKRAHLVVSLRYVVGDKSAQTLAITTQHSKNSDCTCMATNLEWINL